MIHVFWDTFRGHRLREPRNAFPTGTRVYTGFQGSGKTLGMVDYAFRIAKSYPDSKIFSNVALKGLSSEQYTFCANNNDILNALSFNNGSAGVLVLIDEAHLFFGRKSGIPLDVLTSISQQRKNRRRIVFSSQIWEELDISLRKQVKEIVQCKQFFGLFVQRVSNGETLTYDKQQSSYVAKVIRTNVLRKAKFLGTRFDTHQEIVNNSEYHRDYTSQPVSIVVERKKSLLSPSRRRATP